MICLVDDLFVHGSPHIVEKIGSDIKVAYVNGRSGSGKEVGAMVNDLPNLNSMSITSQ
jgi:hypothetical protein